MTGGNDRKYLELSTGLRGLLSEFRKRTISSVTRIGYFSESAQDSPPKEEEGWELDCQMSGPDGAHFFFGPKSNYNDRDSSHAQEMTTMPRMVAALLLAATLSLPVFAQDAMKKDAAVK